MIGFILLPDFIGDLLPYPLKEMISILVVFYGFSPLPYPEKEFLVSPFSWSFNPFFPDHPDLNLLIWKIIRIVPINRGADCAIIKDGYHYEGTSCFIFYPADIGRFKEVINSELDTHTRYDACIDIGAPHSMRFDKSYARRLIRNYQIPEKSEIIKSALDFLTWEVKK